jgi:6-phospho-beta-glucosidase
LIGALTRPLEKTAGLKFHLTRTTDVVQALQGADFVITTFRVGGIASRVIDERVPLSHGVLGQETTGPGGFAMGMRTIPVILETVEQLRTYCPDAWLINFANPAGMLAEAVAQTGWKRVVGICDAPTGMQRVAAAVLGAPVEEIFLDYFGLNHLGWVRSVLFHGQDVLPKFLQMAQQAGELPDLPFQLDFIAALGMIPNEYLYYYYHADQAVKNILQAGRTRGEQIAKLNEELFASLKSCQEVGDQAGMLAAYRAYLQQRGQTYMAAETGKGRNQAAHGPFAAAVAAALSGEGYAGVALDLIEGLQGQAARSMILNIPNQGALPGMGAGDVVEVPALVSRDLVRPLAAGEVPAACLGLMQQVKAYEQATIRAAREHSYSLAVQALVLHPLVRDYNLARRILDGYIEQHAENFPALD